ncbi:hypothetical protein, partial [Raoultella sp. YJ]|uniref:hypothetical protein n=1 Tax=Raoultella sp. YJ TaxID=1850565 RepID=UPI00197CFCD7
AQSKDWAFCFICCLSGNAHREQDNIAGNAVEPPEAGPGGGEHQDDTTTHAPRPAISSVKSPSSPTGFLRFGGCRYISLFISRGAEYIPLLFMTLYLLIENIIFCAY